jgi:hypothetical protein
MIKALPNIYAHAWGDHDGDKTPRMEIGPSDNLLANYTKQRT